MSLEQEKKKIDFDEKLSNIIITQIRQPKGFRPPPELVRKIRERVDPKIVAKGDEWVAGADGDAKTSGISYHGDIRFRVTDGLLALFRTLVVAFHAEQNINVSKADLRKKVNQLKLATESGVAEIKAPSKSRRR